MGEIHFITSSGIIGLTVEWDVKCDTYDCPEWLEKFGHRIGAGTAPLPNGRGWVDLSQFAAVISAND